MEVLEVITQVLKSSQELADGTGIETKTKQSIIKSIQLKQLLLQQLFCH